MKQPDRHSETDRVERTQRGWVFLPVGYMLALIGWGLGFEPRTIPQGLLSIAQAPGLLVSDYLAIGGLGAAFVNAGLVGLAGLLLSHFNDLRLSSPTISASSPWQASASLARIGGASGPSASGSPSSTV